MTTGNRVGTFLMWVGGFFLLMFVFSIIALQPALLLLVTGAPAFGLGIFLWIGSPKPKSAPSGRFRVLQKKKKAPPAAPPAGSAKPPRFRVPGFFGSRHKSNDKDKEKNK